MLLGCFNRPEDMDTDFAGIINVLLCLMLLLFDEGSEDEACA